MKKKLSSIVCIAILSIVCNIQLYASNPVFPEAIGLAGYVTGTSVNVRTAPDIGANILGQLSQQTVYITGQNESHYKVNYDNRDAWISKEYVTPYCNEELIPYYKVEGQDIVRYGMEFIGTPYVWGGNDLRTGVDCSGLTSEVYKAYGIPMYRVTSDQVEQGIPISKDNLQTGDLIFFNTIPSTHKEVSHVGIYVDQDKFLHSDGTHGVMLSSLNSSYYQEKYVKAIRIID